MCVRDKPNENKVDEITFWLFKCYAIGLAEIVYTIKNYEKAIVALVQIWTGDFDGKIVPKKKKKK